MAAQYYNTRERDRKTKRFEKYGPWAVVTGASSGMGREFARQLAADGLSLVIAARRIDRLETLAAELEAAQGIEVRPVEADLSDEVGVETIAKAAADIELGLVVSNAGSAVPGAFLKVSLEDQLDVVELNVSTAVQLAHTLGGQMVERERGGFIFIGSTSAFNGAPYLANYAATKAYLGVFGESLHVEWKKHGVDVLVVHPGPTRTEMADMDGVDFDKVPAAWMTAEKVAAKSLAALGKRPLLVPGGSNKFGRFLMTRLLPRKITARMWGSLMKKATDDDCL